MNNVDQDITKRHREVLIELLDEFVRICNENNLGYFLTSGTLIGAVRHKGFIPWDDDIDVAMSRDDYEKFLDLFDNDFSEKYYLVSCRSPDNSVYHYEPFAKLCKKGTIFAEGSRKPENYTGINIDIWPFDKCILALVPLQTLLIKFIWKLHRTKNKISDPKNKLKLYIGNFFCLFFSKGFLENFHKKLYLIFNKFNTKYVSFFSGRYGIKRETHKLNEIYPLGKMCFEEKEYCVPREYDIYLKKHYGDDYMELPPAEKRVNHEPKYILFDGHTS